MLLLIISPLVLNLGSPYSKALVRSSLLSCDCMMDFILFPSSTTLNADVCVGSLLVAAAVAVDDKSADN